MLSISKEKLREILSSAYESGWGGCLEFKSEYVEQVMSQFDRVADTAGSSMLTVGSSPTYSVTSSGVFDSSTFIPGYYSSFGQTSPIETLWVNNPGQDAF